MEDNAQESLFLIVNKEAEKIIADGFKAAGISLNDPFTTLAEGLKAEKVTVNKFGVETREEDHATRHKYLVTALELMRVLKSKESQDKPQININNITVNEYDIDERIKQIKKRINVVDIQNP